MNQTHYVQQKHDVKVVQEVLKQGGKVVIIGTKNTNIPDEFQNDSRIELWESTDPQTLRRELPSNTRLVLFTKYISHSLFTRIVGQAKNRNVHYFNNVNTTGELRRMLKGEEEPPPTPVLNGQPIPPVVVPVEKKEPKSVWEGSMKSFVEQHLDPNYQGSLAQEAQRLYKIATEKYGISCTIGSITEASRVTRRRLGLSGPSDRLKPAKVVDMPLPASAPMKVETAPASPSPSAAPTNDDEGLRLLDDAILSLQLFRDYYSKTASREAIKKQLLEKLVKEMETL